jgi:hypothetical protein
VRERDAVATQPEREIGRHINLLYEMTLQSVRKSAANYTEGRAKRKKGDMSWLVHARICAHSFSTMHSDAHNMTFEMKTLLSVQFRRKLYRLSCRRVLYKIKYSSLMPALHVYNVIAKA